MSGKILWLFVSAFASVALAQMPDKDVELLTEKSMAVTSSVPVKRAVLDRPYFLNDFYGPPPVSA